MRYLKRFESRFLFDWTVGVPALLLAWVCALRLLGPGRDHSNYLQFFDWSRSEGFLFLTSFGVDVGFSAILKAFAILLPANDVLWTFVLALVTLGLKFFCFKRLAPSYWVAVLVQVGFFFVLHDYTQLRVSLGIALIMLGSVCWFQARSVGSLIFAWVAAVSVHYTILILLLFALALMYSIGLFLSGLSITLVCEHLIPWSLSGLNFPSDGLVGRFARYLVRTDATPNLFSSRKCFEYVSLALFLYYLPEIRGRNWRMVEYSGWSLLAGMAVFMGFLHYQVISHRVYEMFMAFLPFLMAGLFSLLPRGLGFPYITLGLIIGVRGSLTILG